MLTSLRSSYLFPVRVGQYRSAENGRHKADSDHGCALSDWNFDGIQLGAHSGVPPPFPPLITALLLGYMLASVPSGWRSLTNITPRVFLILPLAGWAMYFVCKLSASAVIGPFILPFKLSSSICVVLGAPDSRLRIWIPLAGFGVVAAVILTVLSGSHSASPNVGQPATQATPQSPSVMQHGNPVTPIAATPMSQEDQHEHQLVGQAEQLYSSGKFDEALASCNEALTLNNGDQAALGLKDEILKAKAKVVSNKLSDNSPESSAIQLPKDSGSALPLPPAPPRPTVVPSELMAESRISGANPMYPPIAKAAHVSGIVVLHITVSATGLVEDSHVVSGPAMLQQTAMDAVKTWRYKPYLLNNEPVEVETTVNLTYSLGN